MGAVEELELDQVREGHFAEGGVRNDGAGEGLDLFDGGAEGRVGLIQGNVGRWLHVLGGVKFEGGIVGALVDQVDRDADGDIQRPGDRFFMGEAGVYALGQVIQDLWQLPLAGFFVGAGFETIDIREHLVEIAED